MPRLIDRETVQSRCPRRAEHSRDDQQHTKRHEDSRLAQPRHSPDCTSINRADASVVRLARSTLPPALAPPPTLRPSATAPAPSTPDLRPPPTCDWTYGLSSDISFSRRLSP